MASADTKRRGITITWSTFTSAIVIIPVVWFIIQPLMLNAMASDIQKTVQTELIPLNTAFVTLLRGNIASMRRQIAVMEFRRDQPPQGDWTENDVQALVNLKLELSTAEAAVRTLTASN